MTKRRAPFIEQRRPIFIGCEGASEAGYAGLLQNMLRDASRPVNLIIHELGRGAGDPLARIELSVQRIKRLHQTRIAPPERFVMLDADQAERDLERAEMARRLAVENRIIIVWQRPCFEAVLLRHLPDRATHQPQDTRGAERALEREWPDYRKPMTSTALGKRVNRDAIRRAAAVEPELQVMLRCLGLV